MTAVPFLANIRNRRRADDLTAMPLPSLKQPLWTQTVTFRDPRLPAGPPDHPADLDAYAQALRALVDATDRYGRGPLARELAEALGEARELLGEDGR